MKKLLIALSSLILMGAVWAQQDMSVDEAVLRTGLQDDAYVILASEMALERAESEDIREFAQFMIDAHAESSDGLQEMTDTQGYEIDFLASPSGGVLLAHLSQLEGTEFEQEYLVQQLVTHQNALITYRTGAAEAEDEDLQRYASQAVGNIASYLARIQELMDAHGFTDPFSAEALESFPTDMQELEAPVDTEPPADTEEPAEEQPEEEQPEEEQPEDEQPEEEQPADDGSENAG